MLNTIIGNKKEVYQYFNFFSRTMVTDCGIRDYDIKKEIEIIVKLLWLFSAIKFNMMELLAILNVKACKTMIKESWCKTATNRLIYI